MSAVLYRDSFDREALGLFREVKKETVENFIPVRENNVVAAIATGLGKLSESIDKLFESYPERFQKEESSFLAEEKESYQKLFETSVKGTLEDKQGRFESDPKYWV